MEYRVKWEIDIEADSKIEAAKKALEIQRNPESQALVFDVFKRTDRGWLDLSDLEFIDLDEVLKAGEL